MIPASFAATEGNIGSSVNETPPVTTPKAITAELTPEQRRKARIEQARLLLADATKRLSHAPAEVSYRGVSEDDTTKTVDNMRKNQSSAFVLRRF